MFRPLIAVVALAAAIAPATAQDTNQAAIAAQQVAMKRLGWMLGVWRGPGSGANRGGPYKVTQTERIGTFLDGTLIVIEGKGYNPDGTIGFHAFGVLSFDPTTGKYTLSSHALGYSGDFTLTPTENGYVWEIPAGPSATIRYTATLSGGVWKEVGDFVAGNQPPRRIFEMDLKRVGNTDWPQGGGITKD